MGLTKAEIRTLIKEREKKRQSIFNDLKTITYDLSVTSCKSCIDSIMRLNNEIGGLKEDLKR